ncbi:Hypothetical protein NTJ_00286 [Nesidiocoris tenuis]|uniref:Uncharacterized protein n=1 Tax=Nesidiocoris tenuis TaxID=355587 RepID=A0ABN7A9C2_9HEMI|nr:Hypothetical protein NTJ_00286 [Nesidiocoris tenuis]
MNFTHFDVIGVRSALYEGRPHEGLAIWGIPVRRTLRLVEFRRTCPRRENPPEKRVNPHFPYPEGGSDICAMLRESFHGRGVNGGAFCAVTTAAVINCRAGRRLRRNCSRTFSHLSAVGNERKRRTERG